MNDRLKKKNGSLQRDKLKMGIGKNERMMEAHRERERVSDRMLTMHWERYGKIGKRRTASTQKTNGGERQGESVRLLVHCCFIVDAGPASAHHISLLLARSPSF